MVTIKSFVTRRTDSTHHCSMLDNPCILLRLAYHIFQLPAYKFLHICCLFSVLRVTCPSNHSTPTRQYPIPLSLPIMIPKQTDGRELRGPAPENIRGAMDVAIAFSKTTSWPNQQNKRIFKITYSEKSIQKRYTRE